MTAEIIELFGVRFTGRRDEETGRIYIPVTPESKLGLAMLGRVGREMQRMEPAPLVSCALKPGQAGG